MVNPSIHSATELSEGLRIALKIGFPVLLKPSFGLGASLKQVDSEAEFEEAFMEVRNSSPTAEVGIEKA